ncbi:MAG TPA: hypothetical protein VJQ47_18705 [Steroidobacteraceae bacterium]|nr:hypothetical protein [Steroidobacteraceae bacterium]
MLVVTVNTGSTSVKLAAFTAGAETLTRVAQERHSDGKLSPQTVLESFQSGLPEAPAAIAHRVVHGGTKFPGPVRIDPDVRAAIEQLSELAPLHNPHALEWIDAAREAFGAQAVAVAVFDTSFFFSLPRVAAEYAVPRNLGVEQGVRRYGFHGLAHEGMWRRWCQLRPKLPKGGRLISLQLGGGCSVAAIHQGRPLDISMGFSPLEGLVMATRSGDIDAAVVSHLQRRLDTTSDHIITLLNNESGICGLTGGRTDLGSLVTEGSEEDRFALELYCYRARKYVGAYLAVLGGCDGIVFGGGVGEHVPEVRSRILDGMSWAGIELDPLSNNAARGREARLDAAKDAVQLWVVPTEEEPLLAQAALDTLSGVVPPSQEAPGPPGVPAPP